MTGSFPCDLAWGGGGVVLTRCANNTSGRNYKAIMPEASDAVHQWSLARKSCRQIIDSFGGTSINVVGADSVFCMVELAMKLF